MSEKYYQLGTHTTEQWKELHEELIADGNVYEAVPVRQVQVDDTKLHSPTRGTYLLTEEEANELKNDPRVKFINIDYSKYDEFKPPQNELQMTQPSLFNRYSSAVRHYREFETSNTLPATPGVAEVNRTGYQILRLQQTAQSDPWIQGGLADNDIVSQAAQARGSGKNIDVVVADEGMWIGHPEFQNDPVLASDGTTAIELPADFAGNVLPGDGTCTVLDLVLDSPYYIDPDWFDADSENRLTTRWDGTTVPVESVALAWWANPLQRSSQFSSEGTVSISSSYTRENTSGSNNTRPAGLDGEHGTPCGALTYGRTQGWAYNANKWTLDLYGTYGSGIEAGFDLTKLFHQLKPKNPAYDKQDPTVMSNSWGYRSNKAPGLSDVNNSSTLYYTHRASSNVSYTTETGIAWLSHMGLQGDGGRWKSEMKTNSLTTALDELIDSGVIFVCAAGNSNQKCVSPTHPDYDNYITDVNGGSLADSSVFEFGVEVFGTTNRRGFPQQGGKFTDTDGAVKYKTINIGALDDDYNTGLESKVDYSDRGDSIDCYTPADGTLAANKSYTNEGPRVDTYSNFTYSGGAYDCAFGGTSAACPVAAGFIATVLEHNRDWTWREIIDWINSLDAVDPADFYYGVESTTPNSANWTDYESLEGGTPKVLYQNNYDSRFVVGARTMATNLNLGGAFTLKANK
jgi:hypothetical protein